VPKIVQEKSYNGAQAKTERLGLAPLMAELRSIVEGFDLRVREVKDANGGAAVRKMLDQRFGELPDWNTKVSGDIDWRKCTVINGTRVCIGVEVQFSARSDLLVIDLIHLRKAIDQGEIDVGILVVPSDTLGRYLTDRAPKFADAVRHITEARVESLPLVVIALEHDGPGPALAKQVKADRVKVKGNLTET